MNRQKDFEKPSIVIITFSYTDVLTTSGDISSFDNDSKPFKGWNL